MLNELGCGYYKEQAGMFMWAKSPEGYKDGYELSDEVLYDANVFITPGGIFGSAGEKYIRISLTLSQSPCTLDILHCKDWIIINLS